MLLAFRYKIKISGKNLNKKEETRNKKFLFDRGETLDVRRNFSVNSEQITVSREKLRLRAC